MRVFAGLMLLLATLGGIAYLVVAGSVTAQTSTVVTYEREIEIIVTINGTDLVLIPNDEAVFLAIDLSRVTGLSMERVVAFETVDGVIHLPVHVQVTERLSIVRNEALNEVEPTAIPTPTVAPIVAPTSEPIVVEVTGLRAEKIGDSVFLYLTHAALGLSGFAFTVTGSIVAFDVPEYGLVNRAGNEVTAVDLNGLIEPGPAEAFLFSVIVELPGPTVPGPGVLIFEPAAVDDDNGDPIDVAVLRIDF